LQKESFILSLLLLVISINPVFAEDKTYRVGVYDNKPIIFKDASGKLSGLSIDILESVAKQEGIQFEYIHAPWKEVLSALEKGELDLLVGIAYSQERAKKFDYTLETVINNWGVVYRNPSVSISSLEGLKGKRVALLERSIHSKVFNQIMAQFQFEFEAVGVTSYLDGLQLADEGKVDAVVINRVTSLLNALNYDVLETGIIFNPVEVRIASPKGKNSDVLSLIDKHLAQQKSDINSTYHQSLIKWLNAPVNRSFPSWALYSLGVIFFILMMMAIMLLIIRRQVRLKTAALSDSESRFRQLAENINEIFWIGSPDWKEIFYISPAYEKIWGQKTEKLYQSAYSWHDSIHPDDRDMVIEDMKRKASGDLSNPAFPQYRIIRDNGDIRWISARAYPVRDPQGKIIKITGIAEDITSRIEVEDQIHFMAMHDPLTKLFNRFAFEQHFDKILQNNIDHDEQYALLYIDLDQFKIVNDTCGHTAGDKMLAMLADMLRYAVIGKGLIARLGGDEFGIILNNSSTEAAQSFAQDLLDEIKEFRFAWKDKRFSVGASIGLVMIDSDSYNRTELLSAADMACYAAKDMGRNRIHTFTHDDEDMLQRHGEMQFVERINRALEEDRFVLHRQIISSLQDKDMAPSYEYLVRLMDEEGNLLYPGAFMPAAERYELMPKLDRWVVTHVFEHLQSHQQNNFVADGLPAAFINLSGQIFSDGEFPDFIIEQAQRFNLEPQSICLEITETSAISNITIAGEFINRLRRAGFKFALDDFGTGMSSFSYLQSLHVDVLKIDGVFCKSLHDNDLNTAIIEAITNIAHKTHLKVIAEWIETQAVQEKLTQYGVDFGQGYFIGKPEPLPEHPDLQIAQKQ